MAPTLFEVSPPPKLITVKMEIREGWINYRADYSDNFIFDAPPDQTDLKIANSYKDDFTSSQPI